MDEGSVVERRRSVLRLGSAVLFHPDDGRVQAGGREVRLRPRSAEVLSYLAGRAGEVVAKDELIDALWRGLIVTDNSVAQCVSEIRRALDGAEGVRVLALPRRGYVFEGPVAEVDEQAAPAQPFRLGPSGRWKTRWSLIAGAATAAAALIGWIAWLALTYPVAPTERSRGVRTTVAVLPMLITGNAENGPYAEAFAEFLRSDLARVPGAAVLSRGSTNGMMSFTADAREVARQVRADFVLESAVRDADGGLAIDLQLVDVGDGTVRWREHLQTSRDAFLAAHAPLAARAMQAIRPDLVRVAQPRVQPGGEAQLLALRAWSQWFRATPADNALARSLAERAVALDPELVLGWRVLGASLLLDRVAAWPGGDAPDLLDRAEFAARRALAIDPLEPQVNTIFGAVMVIRGRFAEALAAFDAELEIGRYHEPQVYNWIGLTYLLMGEPERALKPLEMAVWLSPRDARLSYFRRNLSLAYLHMGEIPRAVEVAREAVATSPPTPRAYETLTAACGLAGDAPCAEEALRELLRVAPAYSIDRVEKETSSNNERYVAARGRYVAALRKVGLPETPPRP
jgi:adenylate cyclase